MKSSQRAKPRAPFASPVRAHDSLEPPKLVELCIIVRVRIVAIGASVANLCCAEGWLVLAHGSNLSNKGLRASEALMGGRRSTFANGHVHCLGKFMPNATCRLSKQSTVTRSVGPSW